MAWALGAACVATSWAQGPAAPTPAPAAAAPAPAGPLAPAPPAEHGRAGFWDLIVASGWVGYLIIALSVAVVALGIEHAMTIRQAVLIPPGLAEQVRDSLTQGQVGHAMEFCRQQPSVLAVVLESGLAEADGGWPAVEKSMEDALAEQSARLMRKVEFLSVIGSLAPMLGLLGTVIGMVMAFREVAATQGAARAADLAEGIYLALVTTVEGLIVAIPALGAYAVFRSRVDQLIAATARVAEHAFLPMKRRQAPARTSRPTPPPPVGGSA